ncbi:GntP family permease [Papillibacter cinnamivorans]|uniref:H+/gluconate symporter n=1 Tax=Papillibacter cinnamivorans DSM 12816 TaxID=1122930 RepID=A0A1W1YDI8_9FIRM|nr:GntP family permease [Papillibacter cinnamivorans]SMC34194.1 H+/gluconate symporter [Papillibacter cinnamivorans DSM 12816]
MGILGIIISLALIIFGAYKGWHIFPIAVVGGILVALFNGMNLWTALMTNYASGWMSWAGTYFLLFALGALFGEIMAATGAATSIAYFISDKIGAKRAPFAIAIITLLLTYGGINSFVIAFTLYPIAVIMFNEAKLPRALMTAGLMLGAGTVTQTAMPGTPSVQNLVPTSILGTNAYAAPAIGIVVSIFFIVAGFLYIAQQQKAYTARGEVFVPIPQDSVVLKNNGEGIREEVPSFFASLVPIIIVVVLIFALQNVVVALAGVTIALFFGCLSCYLLFIKRVKNIKKVINTGFSSSIMPLMNTAAIIGYGTVVQASPAFQQLIVMVESLNMNAYVATGIGVNVLAGVTGSSSGGLKIFLNAMGQFYLDKGVNPEAFHRVAAIASGGLDTLPHNGAVISMFAIFGTNHKESYKHVFVLCCLIPIIGTIIAILMANAIYPIG